MKAIRATFVFVLLISFLTIPLKSIAQECNGEYKITATFDANGNKVQTDYGRCDVFMAGTNWLYLHQSGQYVRLELTWAKGNYNEYKKYVNEAYRTETNIN